MVDENNNVLVSYAASDTLYTQAKGRYQNVAYLQYTRSYPCGDKTCSETILRNDQNQELRVGSVRYGAYDALIGKDGSLYEVKSSGLYRNAYKLLTPSYRLEEARLANNPQGDIAMVGIDEQNRVVVGTEKALLQSDVVLAEHGDRDGVLAIYPKTSERLYFAVYKYVNIYNKGVIAGKVDLQSRRVSSGWLVNSSSRNIGFDPEVYVEGNIVRISATDSTHSSRVKVAVAEDDFSRISTAENYPEHIAGFENEEMFNLLVGTSLSYYEWGAESYVSSESVDYSTMEYEISNALYWTLYFEGRIGNTRLGLSYLKNRAESLNGVATKASRFFSFFVDYNGLFSPSSSIRVSVEKGTVNGLSNYREFNQSISSGATNTQENFSATLKRFSAKVMFERGWYGGFEYTSFTRPSAVGFSNSAKDITYLSIDHKLKIEDYLLVAGYDEISYAKRYESDLSRFYIQGHVGFGLSNFGLSSETKNEVEHARAKTLKKAMSMVLDGELDLGYIWQSRFKTLHGLGYAFTGGVKARGSWSGSGQSKESDSSIEANELQLETERYDFWYGPYVSANILF